jgi:hypothetical protein
MEYVILVNGRVVWGPRGWNPFAMDDAIQMYAEATVSLPMDPLTGPVGDLSNVYILEVEQTIKPSFDPLFETLAGPTWIHDVPNRATICIYEVVEDNYHYIASRMKSLVATRRWERERQPLEVDVSGVTHTFSMVRDERDRLLIQSLYNADVSWKQADGKWIYLTADEIKEVVTKVNQAVQYLFQEEADISKQIDNATTVGQLKQIYDQVIK